MGPTSRLGAKSAASTAIEMKSCAIAAVACSGYRAQAGRADVVRRATPLWQMGRHPPANADSRRIATRSGSVHTRFDRCRCSAPQTPMVRWGRRARRARQTHSAQLDQVVSLLNSNLWRNSMEANVMALAWPRSSYRTDVRKSSNKYCLPGSSGASVLCAFRQIQQFLTKPLE